MVLVISLVAVLGTVNTSEAAGGPTVYARFDSHEAKGIVEVQHFGSGLGSEVTARIQRPRAGIVGFCLYRQDGTELSCQTVNPDFSEFGATDKGCVSFTITFSEEVAYAAVTDLNFVRVKALALLVEREPTRKELGQLKPCS